MSEPRTLDDRHAGAGESASPSVVVITRNRRAELLATVDRLGELPEVSEIIVIDNGSTDGTAPAVREELPHVQLVALPENLGAAARTVGVELARSPWVAFADDDSWWERGSLRRAVELFEEHPRLAVIAARVEVGPDHDLDPTCETMSRSPLGQAPDLPGPSVLGFVACGAVVRRAAYLSVGGFDSRFGVGGEEALLAIDLACAGWGLAYVDEVVARHAPSRSRDPAQRRRHGIRNDLWTTWLRMPLPAATRHTSEVVRGAARDAAARRGVVDAVRSVGPIVRQRSVVPPRLASQLSVLDRHSDLGR